MQIPHFWAESKQDPTPNMLQMIRNQKDCEFPTRKLNPNKIQLQSTTQEKPKTKKNAEIFHL